MDRRASPNSTNAGRSRHKSSHTDRLVCCLILRLQTASITTIYILISVADLFNVSCAHFVLLDIIVRV